MDETNPETIWTPFGRINISDEVYAIFSTIVSRVNLERSEYGLETIVNTQTVTKRSPTEGGFDDHVVKRVSWYPWEIAVPLVMGGFDSLVTIVVLMEDDIGGMPAELEDLISGIAERVTRELMSAAVTETLLAGGIAGAGETLGVSLAAAVVAYIAIEAIEEILNAIFNAMDDDRIGTGTVSFTAPEFTEKSVPMPPVGVPSEWRGQQGIIERISVGSGGDSGEYELMFGFIRT